MIADFLNEKGELVAREYGVVYPRTIRYKRMKGRFSVKTKIDNTIATCVLKLAWHGKRQ